MSKLWVRMDIKKNAKNWDGFIQNWQSTFFASPMLGCCLRKTATFFVESWYIVQMSRISCKSNWSRGPISQVCCVRMCGICTNIFSKKSAKYSRTTYQLKEVIWATTSLHSDDSVLSSTTKLNHGICKKNTPKVASCGAPQKITLNCP